MLQPIKRLASRYIVKWRKRRSQKHLSGWDIPTYDHDSGDLTAFRDVVAEMLETDRLRATRGPLP